MSMEHLPKVYLSMSDDSPKLHPWELCTTCRQLSLSGKSPLLTIIACVTLEQVLRILFQRLVETCELCSFSES